ncbi:energy-coupling factor ABC transporter ATP-binding protein [Pelodictyon phaeoclathratiforme]|uniref:ABC transporter related n=1 Tax=Pelodictyon phaeoclathratiforme (strain DSM 5477 / BU-1) TaxID=324925 RepID=B4SCY2_PELPB|nr:ABC transporter ATP-binding protein [Pelodictyon phaeoclathratiforme]ACF42816.1 ABC transporter related [Pelodictyon phaeoclathratiforme BU-1]MBV5327957.1 ABC transporter ATP-binding protein [Chlorobium sp.]
MIAIEGLCFSWPDGTKAIDHISLAVGEGDSVGIVGANGAGKSTLVNHLNGYFLPQKGSISIGGVDLNKKNLDRIHRMVGLLFQNPDDQLFTARLYDDVAFGPENLGMDAAEVAMVVEARLRELNLWELRNRAPSQLSQGQKRFASFAAVLVMKPEVMVMDEPTADLDPKNRRKLINLVNGLGITRITVSHDLDFIQDTCQRVCIMKQGRITADGPTEEILGNRELLEANDLELPLRLQR